MLVHPCHAWGCRAPCALSHLMCPRHWRMVPAAVRRAVWGTCPPGPWYDKEPTAEWLTACRAAILAVAFQEGRAGRGLVRRFLREARAWLAAGRVKPALYGLAALLTARPVSGASHGVR